MKTMIRRAALVLSLLLAPMAFAQDGAAPAAAVAPASYTDADIDRLTDLVSSMMPLGELMQAELKKTPNWAKEKGLSNEQETCITAELTQEGFRRYKRADVAAYAAAHPDQVKKDLELLAGGAAVAFSKILHAGMDAGDKGMDVAKVMSDLSEAELRGFMALQDESNRPLVQMIGIEDVMAGDESKSEATALRLMTAFVGDRAGFCHVNPSDI